MTQFLSISNATMITTTTTTTTTTIITTRTMEPFTRATTTTRHEISNKPHEEKVYSPTRCPSLGGFADSIPGTYVSIAMSYESYR